MVERESWAVPTGQSVEDGRVAISALLTPAAAAVSAKTGFRPAPGNPGQVTASGTPDGVVHVAPFQAFLQTGRASAGGAYIVTLDATKDINILSAPADPSNPRNDLIIAQQTDMFYGDGSSALSVKSVVGTPSGTPVDPAVTGSTDYITLARVRVRANASSILGTDITDLRPTARNTVAVGGLLPVSSQAVRDALAGLYNGFAVWRQDRGWAEIYDGAVWHVQGIAACTSTNRPPQPNPGDRLYETDTGFAYVYNGTLAKWLREPVTIVKSGDTAWTSTTTLSNDPDLTFPEDPNSQYQFELTIGAETVSTAVGLKVALTFPAGGRADYSRTGLANSVYFNDWQQNPASGLVGSWSTVNNWATIEYKGKLVTGSTAGSFAVQAAQIAANASSAWILRGSTLKYRQVG